MAQVLPQGKKKVLQSKKPLQKKNSVRITGFEKDQNFTKSNVFKKIMLHFKPPLYSIKTGYYQACKFLCIMS